MEALSNGKQNFIEIIRGVFLAILVTLVSILVFALLLRFCGISDSAIKPVNIFIRLISIFIGVFFSVKESGGLWKGLIIGFLTETLCFLLFSVIAFEFNFTFVVIVDVVAGTVAGGISGVIKQIFITK